MVYSLCKVLFNQTSRTGDGAGCWRLFGISYNKNLFNLPTNTNPPIKIDGGNNGTWGRDENEVHHASHLCVKIIAKTNEFVNRKTRKMCKFAAAILRMKNRWSIAVKRPAGGLLVFLRRNDACKIFRGLALNGNNRRIYIIAP